MLGSRTAAASFKDDNEGTARVVAVEGNTAWLEPEQTGSCSGCGSVGACGAKGIGTVANRLEARRFALLNEVGLCVGERVVVAFGQQALVGAAALAYMLPLVVALLAAVVTQEIAGKDGLTLLATVFGLVVGFGLMKLIATRLTVRGALKPRIVRRLGVISIHPTGA
ncbi:MAG TPA: SoxR reducing system RseC family protein [Zoogloea sp.]|jgi:sigma-E factor negative regulatory protein RseC|nr:SoxR reducing system RseC family protein [Zoogloea sp.]